MEKIIDIFNIYFSFWGKNKPDMNLKFWFFQNNYLDKNWGGHERKEYSIYLKKRIKKFKYKDNFNYSKKFK